MGAAFRNLNRRLLIAAGMLAWVEGCALLYPVWGMMGAFWPALAENLPMPN